MLFKIAIAMKIPNEIMFDLSIFWFGIEILFCYLLIFNFNVICYNLSNENFLFYLYKKICGVAILNPIFFNMKNIKLIISAHSVTNMYKNIIINEF